MMLLPTLLLLASVQNCADPQTQADMTICAGQEYKAADAALNAQWKTTYAYMKDMDRSVGGSYPKDQPGYAATLLASQRAWLAFRDAQCKIEGYSARGGSMEPMVVNSCLADLTRRRTQALKDLVREQ